MSIQKTLREKGCLTNDPKWDDGIEVLRELLLDSGLVEEIKWDKPTYTLNGKNVIVIQGFKKYCALLFIKGNLVDDGKGVLVRTGANTEIGRQIRFTNLEEIIKSKVIVKKYIQKAIEVEKSGVKADPKKSSTPLQIPSELEEKFEEFPNFKEAWEKLTPGRQKGYLILFNGAKHSETKIARIEKYMDQILEGIGLHDQY